MSSTKDFIDEVKGCLGGRSSNAESITYKNANFPQCKDVDAALDTLFDKAHDPSEDSGSGPPGKSAYEIAVNNGFTGTEGEWLVSLKGDKGDPGTDGRSITGITTDENNNIIVKFSDNTTTDLGSGITVIDWFDADHIAEAYEFNQKKSVWFGDSITKGFLTATTTVDNTFVSIFSDLVKMLCVNNGLTSSLWTSNYREISTFLDVIKSTDLSNFDYVFINGGINDYHSSVTMNDFESAVDETLSYLHDNYKGKVIVISPFNSVETELSFNPAYNINDYRKIIRTKCIKYDFSYISGGSLLTPSTTGFASNVYFVDNYHLNQSGHQLAGARLAERFLNCELSDIYSLDEQIVGIWMNKPLYRKVIHTGALASTAGITYTQHNVTNIEKIVKIYGVAYSGIYTYTLPWSSNTENSNISIWTGSKSVGITIGKDQSSITDSYVTIEYTKTND